MVATAPPAPQADLDGAPRRVGLGPLDDGGGTLTQRVYRTLKAAILDLRLPPGAMIRKPDLCAELGVSRSPVSEAIVRLAAEGLVAVVPQAGSFVAPFSMEEIREGAFLREALELAAVEDIAPRIAPHQIDRLRDNLSAQEAAVRAGDRAAFYNLDSAMHEAILSATGHRRLAEVARTSWLQVDRARRLILPEPGRVAETLDEHRRVVDALARHDASGARQAMRDHLRQLVRHLEPLTVTHPHLFGTR